MTTPHVDPIALWRAVNTPTFRDKRAKLRKLIHPIMEQHFPPMQMHVLIGLSPLIVGGSDEVYIPDHKRVSVRPVSSGFRDLFDVDTMLALAYAHTPDMPVVADTNHYPIIGSNAVSLIIGAITSPHTSGMTSTTSKTGYAFGRPGSLGAEAINAMHRNLNDYAAKIGAKMEDETDHADELPDADEHGVDADDYETAKSDDDDDIGETFMRAKVLDDEPRTIVRSSFGALSLTNIVILIENVMAGLAYKTPVADVAEAFRAVIVTHEHERIDAAFEMREMSPSTEAYVLGDKPVPGYAPGAKTIFENVMSLLVSGGSVTLTMDESTADAPDEGTLTSAEMRAIGEVVEAMAASAKDAATTTTETPVHKETARMTTALKKPDADTSKLINMTLSAAGLPPITTILDRLTTAESSVETQKSFIEEVSSERDALKRAVEKMKMAAAFGGGDGDELKTKATDTTPEGKLVFRKAHAVFGITKGKDAFDFDVPCFEWTEAHPLVPEVDEGYVFRPFELLRVLYAIVTNQRCYLHGHTGTGKTTLVQQVAARLKFPSIRINFDSEISRMDLIGRDTLISEVGPDGKAVTVSKFVDGVLPQMMQSPCIGIYDELDFVRPDISYVMQRVLEGDSLVITEDGGRVVKPHPMFRAFATGNTVGQGDEYGMYAGARVQSSALLDRFGVWVKIDYLSPDDRMRLLKAKVPSLDEPTRVKLNRYVTEHLEAFTTSKVLQPISPRGMVALGNALTFYLKLTPSSKTAVTQALEATVLDRASVQDRAVLKGLADRVFA